MWKFTKHAKIRVEERRFDAESVLKVLNAELPSYVIQSPREKTVDLYFSKINQKHVLIVVDRISKTIITIRPMRKNEIREYMTKMEVSNE